MRASRWETWSAYGWANAAAGAVRAAARVRSGGGFAWDLLRHGHCVECPLGVVGLADEALPLHVCVRRIDALDDWARPALDQRTLPPLSELRDRSEAELRALGRLGRPLLHRGGKLGSLGWDDALHFVDRRLKPGWAAWIADREVSLEAAHAMRRLATETGGRAGWAGAPARGAAGEPPSLAQVLDADCIGVVGPAVRRAPVLGRLLAVALQRGARTWGLAEERDSGWDAGQPAIDEHVIPQRGGLATAASAVVGGGGAEAGVDPVRLAGLRRSIEEADQFVLLVAGGVDAQELTAFVRASGGRVLRVDGGAGAEGLWRLGLEAAAPADVVWGVGPIELPGAAVRIHSGAFLHPGAVAEGEEVLLLPASSPLEQVGGATFVGMDGSARLGPQVRGGPVDGARDHGAIAAAVAEARGRRLPDEGVALRRDLATWPGWAGLESLSRAGDSFRPAATGT